LLKVAESMSDSILGGRLLFFWANTSSITCFKTATKGV